MAAIVAVPLAFGAGLGVAALVDGDGRDGAGPEDPPAEAGGPGPTIDMLGSAPPIPRLRAEPRPKPRAEPSEPPVAEAPQSPPPSSTPPASSPPPVVTPPSGGSGGGSSEPEPQQPREPPPIDE